MGHARVLLLRTAAVIGLAWAGGVVAAREQDGDARRDAGGFIPERVDRSKLHPPPPPARREPRLYERVEREADRGRGRVEDAQGYELRRLERSRDERLGRVTPRRERQRVQEDLDRRQDVAAAAGRRQHGMAEKGREAHVLGPAKGKTPSEADAPPASFASPMMRQAEADRLRLEELRERYQADLRQAEQARDEVLRRPGATRRDRAEAARTFEQRRLQLTQEYQRRRRAIIGEQ